MLVSLFRKFASGTMTRSRRRIAIARTPRFESLEDRKVPAILTLPVSSLPTFTITLTLPGAAGANTYANVPVSGGNFQGTYSTTSLSSSYGLGPQLGIYVGISYYSASENSNGTTYGTAVPNAGSITWLLANYGPSATSAGLQDALQAAIWRTEFGSNFELDGIDNSVPISPSSVNALIGPTYQAELAALGNNTLPVSDAMWITPYSAEVFGSAHVEGLVALGQTVTPAATATFVTSSVNPVKRGRAVTFSATVLADQSLSGHGDTSRECRIQDRRPDQGHCRAIEWQSRPQRDQAGGRHAYSYGRLPPAQFQLHGQPGPAHRRPESAQVNPVRSA